MADAGLLGRVRWVSSVSGGSITNGLLAHAYNELRDEGFTPATATAVRKEIEELAAWLELEVR